MECLLNNGKGLQATLADLYYGFGSFLKPEMGFQYGSRSYVDMFYTQINRSYFLRRCAKPFIDFEPIRQIILNDEYRLQPFP